MKTDLNPSKEYYNVYDIIKITGAKKSKCYDIIRKLNDRFQKEYPNSIPIKGKIPIWYFREKMGSKPVNDSYN